MQPTAATLTSEAERLAALHRYDILDTGSEPQFDRIVQLAARMFGTPMAVISFIDADRVWFKARFGVKAAGKPRTWALSEAAFKSGKVEVVRDAGRTARLRKHPLVTSSPNIRFFATAPIYSADRHPLGAISVLDTRPRADLSPDRFAGLEALGRLVEAELESRRMSQRLAAAAERFRDLAEVSSDWVWETDSEHRLVDLTSGLMSMTGIAPAGIGRRRWEFVKSRPLHGTWADHIAGLDARREFRGFEYEAETDQGEHRVFRLNGRPYFDDDGRFLGYRGTGTDITRQRAEELARAVNQRLFETSPDLILVTDRKGRLVLVSPSALNVLGYRPEEMVGRSGIGFVHKDDLAAVRNEMRLARLGNAPSAFDCRYVGKDGRVVPLSWIGVWSAADQYHFFIGRDITERIAAEERQRQSQRLEAVGQLTGGIAHDFNNILSIMTMKIEHATEILPEESEARALLASALAAGVRGADLISRLMTFARRRPLKPTETSIGPLLEEFATLLRTALSRRIPLRLDIAGDLRLCRIDRTGLETALLNLTVNARDAMPAGGTVTLTARNRVLTPADVDARPDLRVGQWIEIGVSDTGLGMPPEVQARIFEPFFTTKSDGKGTGLGLAMVHGFVHQSGGFISLKSEVGQGTTFWIYLPAVAVPKEAGRTRSTLIAA